MPACGVTCAWARRANRASAIITTAARVSTESRRTKGSDMLGPARRRWGTERSSRIREVGTGPAEYAEPPRERSEVSRASEQGSGPRPVRDGLHRRGLSRASVVWQGHRGRRRRDHRVAHPGREAGAAPGDSRRDPDRRREESHEPMSVANLDEESKALL